MTRSVKQKIFQFKNKLIRGRALEHYDELLKNSKLDSEDLRNITLVQLKKLFAYAKANIPYYSAVFKDIDVEDIKNFDDWENLPVLTKQDIKANIKQLMPVNISKNRLRVVSTGGSTGEPLKLYHDKLYFSDVLGWRVLNWWGCEPSDNIAFIYRKVKTGWRATLNALLWYPTKRIFLDASMMTSTTMDVFLNKIQTQRPKVLQGYVGGVYEFAKYCRFKGITFDFFSAVWVTSAPLSETQRRLMDEVFKAPVYDQYGCSEVYWLAAECLERNGLHVFSDERYIEMVDHDKKSVKKGQFGVVTITDLGNYAFPLIRYQNGDRGRYLERECSCGLPFPLIDKVKGRVTDVIKLPNGNIIAGDFLTTIFDNEPDTVHEFQIHQREDYSITLKCVLGDAPNARANCDKKIKELEELVANEISISLCFVDNIKHDNGKTRYIISDIK
ncbi:phenylacetate--CoA ligase family protein [Thalassotalea mangrovi]|uniref:Phenylacetate--CoA ligase family protein n=1 Tax=Thalassotalea mangrovi TaxID=2572245 RepID=A0A4U1B6H3_9GAMM|nr:phenylacetate--CoA ligase family protein [Thalassotalea mangrovi]TKB46141.1 phenylacetate--CoA ligase family protein [Thalassotalea mangrovi]